MITSYKEARLMEARVKKLVKSIRRGDTSKIVLPEATASRLMNKSKEPTEFNSSRGAQSKSE